MLSSFTQSLLDAEKTWTPRVVKKYKDIEGELPLLKGVFIPTNTHLGQRKLALNEMLFYNSITDGTIIYSGSASGEHTPFMLDLYPNLNFVMIDPNYHLMDYDFWYVYKKVSTNDDDIEAILELTSPRAKSLKGLIKRLKDKRCVNGRSYDALKKKTFGWNDFVSMPSLSFKESRVLVIQDYMNGELADFLKAKIGGPIYHISDIRSSNDDSGVLFDNALQIVIQHHLGCLSHIKC